jgi:uncharacterized protein (DUF2062 family)
VLPSPKRFVQLIKSMLLHGLTPAGISLTIALGLAGSVFPILGTNTLVCLFFAAVFRLNHAIMQSVNWLGAPLQLLLIFPFLRLGERIFGAAPVPLSLTQLMSAFREAPLDFLARFSMSFVHCIAGWLLVMPAIVLATHLVLLVLFRRFVRHHPVPPAPQPALPS